MKRSAGWLVVVLFLVAARADAQVPSVHAPDGNSWMRLVSISVPAVPAAPFTLTLATQWVRPLSDGSTITLVNHRMIARDGSGRVFQERRWLVPVGDPNADRISNVQWSDPVKDEYYDCLASTLVCQLATYQPIPGEVPAVPGPAMNGKAFVTVQSLGTRTVEGMETQGTLETTTIAAGAIGNDKPIAVIKEFWYSPELKLNLVVKREDPRSGTQIFTVTNLASGNPSPNLFEMPKGFHLVDHRHTVDSPAQ